MAPPGGADDFCLGLEVTRYDPAVSKEKESRRRVGASPGGYKPPWRPALLALAAAALVLARPTIYPPRAFVYPIARPEAARLSRAFLAERGVDARAWRAVTWPVAGFPRFVDDDAHPELNLPPGRDDDLAARYAVEFGGLAGWERLARSTLPAGAWTTRLMAPAPGGEWFVTLDPRTRRVVGFWYNGPADSAAGAPLDEARARAAADTLLGALRWPGRWTPLDFRPGGTAAAPGAPAGTRPARLLLADSTAAVGAALPVLTLLFAPDGTPRGFGAALRLPVDYVAARTLATPLSTLLVLLRLALLVTLGGLGLVEVARRLRGRGEELRLILRVVLVSLLPILLFHLNRLPTLLARYPAHVPWSAFLAGSAVGLLLSALLQALLFGVALAALAAARPDWREALPPRAWRASARAALATALLALAWGVIVDRLELLARITWPALFPGPLPPVLPGYGAIYPFFDVVWTALTGSALVGGLVSLLWLLSRGPFRSRPARVVALLLVAVALGPDRALNAAEAVVPTFYEVLALVTAIFLARRLARGTLGAYVAVLPLALGGQTALWLARQPEPQVRLGGIVAFLLLGVPLAILAVQGARRGN